MLHDQLLGTKHYFYALSRFAVALGIVAGALFARWAMGIHLDVAGLTVLAAILFVYNIGVFLHARQYCDQPTTEESRPVLVGLMNASIAIDFLFLTVALWMVGGAQSPFKAFYILHVIIAAVLLPHRMAYAHAALGYGLFALLALAEWRQWIPTRFPEGLVATAPEAISGRFLITILSVQGLLLAVTVFLLTRLTRRLRQGEREMRKAQSELERFTEMQRNFLRIAMHDAKSPVSGAISLLYNIQAELLGPLTDQQRQTTDRILERLQSVLSLFRDFEVLSALDSVSPEMQGTPVDMGRMVNEIVKAHSDQAGVHGHALTVDIEDGLPPVQGIETLLRESVVNLVTNAIKYTPDGGKIAIRALSINGARERSADAGPDMSPGVRVEVEDNGIGIAQEDQETLFKEFVRIRRQDRPLRDQGGSGLGLSNVRRIVELHNGRFGVRSDKDQGSLFYLELPARGE